jgi:peptidyl-prolyl cis-trans isomerase C
MYVTKFSQLLVVSCFGLVMAAAAQAQSAGTVAKVNGVAIPQARLELILKERAAKGQSDSPEAKKALREVLIRNEVVAQEAVKKGLDQNVDVATQIDIARQSVLFGAYQNDFAKTHPVGDEDMRKEYEGLKAQMGDKEYKVRHILVGTEQEAKDIIVRIKKGAKFDKLAAEKSKDASSKNKGGELDWTPAGTVVKPIADVLAKLSKGQLAEQPVQSQGGWQVIRLDDVRPLRIAPLEKIRQVVQQRVLRRQFAASVNELRAKATVE